VNRRRLIFSVKLERTGSTFKEMQGDEDARNDWTVHQTEKLVKRFFRFELLDDVFKEFLATNVIRLQLGDLLNFDDKRFPGATVYTTFLHESIPYMATVFLFEKNGERWVNVKLHNDGFWYDHYKGLSGYVSRHNHDKWVLLSKAQVQYFKAILSTFADTHRVAVFYNYFLKRVDFKLKANDQNTHDNVVITFEPGYPDYENDIAYEDIPIDEQKE
jgi:hypothetical protein